MLHKTILVGLNILRPRTLNEGIFIHELLEVTVSYLIKRYLIKMHYNIYTSVNYSWYKVDSSEETIVDINISDEHYTELSNISHILDRFIADTIEEYYIFQKKNNNTVLNFSVILLSNDNVLLTARPFDRS